MTTQWFFLVLIIVGISFDAMAQVFFKKATHHVLETDRPFRALRRIIARWPLIVCGGLFGLTNNICYTVALDHIPVNIAYPMQSTQYVVLALFSRQWLGESISRRRWMAIVLILIGSALVGLGASGN